MECVVNIQNVTKKFRIPHEKRDTLKESLVNIFRKMEYEEFLALNNVNFQINKGDFVGIIGKNGSGKSTLLKIIAGIYQPSSGSISVNGTIAPFLELGVGFEPELTARENIFVNGTLLGIDRKDILNKFNKIIEFAEIEQFVDLKLKNFSSGMRARLAFAIAKEADADIYLVDEVLAVGDEAFQKKCMKVFWDWKKQGKTLIFVSHNPDLVAELCEKAVFLDHGVLKAAGASTEVIRSYHSNIENDGKNNENELKEKKSPLLITQVDFFNSEGDRKSFFQTGETIHVKISYHAKERINKPVFGVAIHRSDGIHITGPNTKTSHFEIEYLLGKGEIECIFHNNSLLAGTYQLSASIFDYPCVYPYDYQDRKFMFTIGKNRDNQYGLVELPVSWRISS